MISVASVDYCERCKCRTLHIPLPSGERACEHHPPGPEASGVREIEVTCERCGKTLTELGVALGAALAHYAACRGAAAVDPATYIVGGVRPVAKQAPR